MGARLVSLETEAENDFVTHNLLWNGFLGESYTGECGSWETAFSRSPTLSGRMAGKHKDFCQTPDCFRQVSIAVAGHHKKGVLVFSARSFRHARRHGNESGERVT